MMKKKDNGNDYRSSIYMIKGCGEKYDFSPICFVKKSYKVRMMKDEMWRFKKESNNAPIYRSESNPFSVISRGSLNWNPYSKR